MFVFMAGAIFYGDQVINIVSGEPIIKKPSEIVCTCGCGQKAVQCGNTCSVARELLKKYKGA
jgi:hypothetical protein